MTHYPIPHGGQPDADTITGPQYEELLGGQIEVWPDGRVEVEPIVPGSAFDATLTTLDGRVVEA